MSPTRRRYLRVVGAALAAPLAPSTAASADDVDVDYRTGGSGRCATFYDIEDEDGDERLYVYDASGVLRYYRREDDDDRWAWYDGTGRLVDRGATTDTTRPYRSSVAGCGRTSGREVPEAMDADADSVGVPCGERHPGGAGGVACQRWPGGEV